MGTKTLGSRYRVLLKNTVTGERRVAYLSKGAPDSSKNLELVINSSTLYSKLKKKKIMAGDAIPGIQRECHSHFLKFHQTSTLQVLVLACKELNKITAPCLATAFVTRQSQWPGNFAVGWVNPDGELGD